MNPAAIAQLRTLLGERVSTSAAVREHHGKDESYFPYALPDAVVYVKTTEEVREVVNICRRHCVPMIPYGVGTSLEGHVLAVKGGVSIALSQMNQVLAVHEEDLDAVVQAGVTRKQLNEYIKHTGLFFPIDPGADATLGGMAATRASGTNAVRYGTMRENVLGLTVVTADGQVIRTGGRARKSSAGYDLTRLFIGSEGTLGIITEVQLRLHGIPEAISAAVCPFETLEGAVDTVILTIQSGIPVARIELLDEVQMGACITYSDLDYPALPTLFFEFHGTEAGVKEQAERVAEIAAELGGQNFRWAMQQEDRTKLWQTRHDAYWAAKALKPGAGGWATDVCVPISKLTECILETKRDLEENSLLAPLVGHVGDGNFHLVYLLEEGNEEEYRRASAHNDRMVMRAIALGGTCTGEHGIGYGKIPFLQAEQGEAVALMRQVKKALDPDNIMNPGKVVTL
jgi:D-lactate dehydrogenase (cytochrome)